MVILSLLVASVAMADTPSTQPAEQYPALMKRMLLLEKENAELKKQVAALSKENETLKAQTSAAPNGELQTGMTLAQVRSKFKQPGDLQSQRAGNATYKFTQIQNRGEFTIYYCTFSQAGKLIAFDRDHEEGTMTPIIPQ